MMTLDTRARRAADSINEAVAGYTPQAGFSTVVVRHRRTRLATTALAGGVAIIVLLVGAWLRSPSPEPDVAVTTTTPSVIEEAAPVVPEVPGPDQGVVDGEATPQLPVDPTAIPPVGDPVSEEPVGEPPVDEEPQVEEPVEPGDTTPPDLTITSPENGAVFSEKRVVFEGTTEPGARVFAGRYEATVRSSGKWSIRLILKEGANGARFTARDEAGNETTKRITVYYEPKKDQPPPSEWEFTAVATFGSCELDPPYDIYYGTGEPGTKITITSEYGGGTATVDTAGNWEKKVIFAEAPYDEPFLVTVKDKYGSKKKFEFVAYEPG